MTEDWPVGCDIAESGEGLLAASLALRELSGAGGDGCATLSWMCLLLGSAVRLVATCGDAVINEGLIACEVFMGAGPGGSITGGRVSTCRSLGVGLATGVESLAVADGLISRCSTAAGVTGFTTG